jgi:hypothetical protein
MSREHRRSVAAVVYVQTSILLPIIILLTLITILVLQMTTRVLLIAEEVLVPR